MADKKLFFVVSMLIITGILATYSLSSYAVIYYNYSQFHFVLREIVVGFTCIITMWFLSRLNVDKYFYIAGFMILFASSFAMIILPFLPDSLATSAGGAKRWIRFPGFSLSPIEFFKVGYVFFVSLSFSRKFKNTSKIAFLDEITILIPHIIAFILIAFLIAVFQNDLGQVVLLGLTFIIMLLFAGGSFQVFALLFVMFLFAGSIGILTSDHRILRLKTWWATLQDQIISILPQSMSAQIHLSDLPEAYQAHNATNAMINGGWFGTGLGEGILKLGYLSDVHTDMVLAGITEEFGIVGLGLCVMAIFYVVFRIFRISFRLKDKFHHLFCVGVAILIGFSFIINSFGVAGITPIKGIAVPFLSYGGSSILAISIALGLILALSNKVDFK